MSNWAGLEEIVAIADTGSFIGAARRLGVSASHVSRVVAELEARLGTELFQRTTRSVHLTEAGRILIEQSRRLIEEREEAFQQLKQEGEMIGEIRLTCSIALGERFVAPIVRRFMESAPRVSVRLELTNRVIDLVSESFDIGIRTGNPGDERLTARQIASRSSMVCASPAYLAGKAKPAHPSELAGHECLTGTIRKWHFMEDGQRRTFVPSGRWQCNSGEAVVEAAIAGMGICQLPTYYLREHIAAGRLVALMEEYRDLPEPIWAVYPHRRYLSAKVRNLIEFLEGELGPRIS